MGPKHPDSLFISSSKLAKNEWRRAPVVHEDPQGDNDDWSVQSHYIWLTRVPSFEMGIWNLQN